MKKLILLLFLSLPVAVFGQQASKGSGIIELFLSTAKSPYILQVYMVIWQLIKTTLL